MKEKIKARLKAKFSGVNLSQTRMDAIADKLAKRLTDESEESEIDEALDDLNEIYSFSDIAKSDDRARSEEAKKKAAKGTTPKKEDEDDDEPNPDEKVPSWAKGLIEQSKTLSEKLSKLESGKTLESRKSTLEAKLKNAPEKVKSKVLKDFQKMTFESDEDFDAYVAETETEVADISQEFSNNGLKGFGKPIKGGGQGGTAEPPKEEVKAIVGDLMKN